MSLSKSPLILFAATAILLLSLSAAAQDHSKAPTQRAKGTRTDKTARDLEAVIRQFWEGLGELDADKIKQSVDFPGMIIESSPTGSKQANVVRSPGEIDEELKRAPASALETHHGEFFGIKLMTFRVQMLGADLASVSYIYRMPPDIVARNPASRSGTFNAVTVLRRDSRTGNSWRIVFTTVPK